MLGKHHIGLTMATLISFFVPLIFLNVDQGLVYFTAFLFAAAIGSLLPDADCGGNSTLHYKYGVVDDVMKKFLIGFIILIFRWSKIKKKIQLEVKREHRGIIHSPIGILLTSLFLSLIPLAIMLIIKDFSFIFLLLVFFGLFVGQLFHLLEDSCTVSGINWAFPFGFADLKGRIYTFQKKDGEKDIRPGLYLFLLVLPSVLLVFGYALGFIIWSPVWVYLCTALYVLVVWFLIIFLSKTNWGFWYQNVETINRIKKSFR